MNLKSLSTAFKALRQLGIEPMALLALYRLGLASGHYRRSIQPYPPETPISPFHAVLAVPSRDVMQSALGSTAADLIAEADEIVRGQVRLFGADPVPLRLEPPQPLRAWTEEERHPHTGDVKLIWEPARFGWALTLARAYTMTQDEAYSRAFWEAFERFSAANPPYQGTNWTSGQEAGLRILAFAFAGTVFSRSQISTPMRMAALAGSMAQHAHRIPGTLVYARAQENNHLISEAAGLFTAACALPEHPDASRWRDLGWKWFHRAIQTQIAPDGTYIQHSSTYHRLMLQASLWVAALASRENLLFPAETCKRLAAAVDWYANLLDPISGETPNLGSNDGALILPLAQHESFRDARPTLQAAAQTFTGKAALPAGPWNEMALWLAVPTSQETIESAEPTQLRLNAPDAWAVLRAAHFDHRPSHADPLHVDLWWQGLNLAVDPGTFLYNGMPPWDNPLGATAWHNTISMDGADAMTPAGKFLWLDWAQSTVLERGIMRVCAQHDGYARRGVLHRRTVTVEKNVWRISDELLPAPGVEPHEHTYTLHWLLADLPWRLEGQTLTLQAPAGLVRLNVETPQPMNVKLIRGGEKLAGEGTANPVDGWFSPTYGVKQPALSLHVTVMKAPPVRIVSAFELGET